MVDKSRINEARQRMDAIAKDQRNMLDKHGASGWTKEVRNEYAALTDEFTRCEEFVSTHNQAVARAVSLDSSAAAYMGQVEQRGGRISMDEATAKARDAIVAFNSWAAYGVDKLTAEQRKIMNIGEATSATNTALVPTFIMPNALEQLKAFGGMRAACQQIATENGNPIQWATYDDTAVQGEWVNENTAPAQAGSGSNNNDLLFGSVTINAHKAAAGPIPKPWPEKPQAR